MKILAIIKDTFRECLVKKILISYFIVSTIGILALLAIVNIDIVDNRVAISTLFSNRPDIIDITNFEGTLMKIESVFAMMVFSFGLFLSIFATADLMPSLVAKGRLDFYLSRPISRPQLILGRYIGAVLVTAVNILYAFVGFWLVIGIKVGYWNPGFFLYAIGIMFMFMLIYPYIILIGTNIKNTIVIIIAVYFMLMLSPVLAQRKEFFLFVHNDIFETIVDIVYWIIPKYYEISLATNEIFQGNPVSSWTPIINSVIIAIVVMNLSMYIFSRKDC